MTVDAVQMLPHHWAQKVSGRGQALYGKLELWISDDTNLGRGQTFQPAERKMLCKVFGQC